MFLKCFPPAQIFGTFLFLKTRKHNLASAILHSKSSSNTVGFFSSENELGSKLTSHKSPPVFADYVRDKGGGRGGGDKTEWCQGG